MSETVKPGQIWEDNDPRVEKIARRHFLVIGIVLDKAIVKTIGPRPRTTRIKLDRFKPTSTGYILIKQDVEEDYR